MFASAVKLAIAVAIAGVVAAQLLARTLPQEQRRPDARLSAAVAANSASAVASNSRAPGRGEAVLAVDGSGHYVADLEIEGSRIRMLVDTGASLVALSYEDAGILGFYPAPSDYKYAVGTANGTARVARVKLRQMRLGTLVVHDVDALIGERGALSSSLLGMSFLSKLSRVEASAGRLVLTQ